MNDIYYVYMYWFICIFIWYIIFFYKFIFDWLIDWLYFWLCRIVFYNERLVLKIIDKIKKDKKKESEE